MPYSRRRCCRSSHLDRAAPSAAARRAARTEHLRVGLGAADQFARRRAARVLELPAGAAARDALPAVARRERDAADPHARSSAGWSRRDRAGVRGVRRARQRRRRADRLRDSDHDPVHRDRGRRAARGRGVGAVHARRDARQADGDRRRRPRRRASMRTVRAANARACSARPTFTPRWTARASSSRATRSRRS